MLTDTYIRSLPRHATVSHCQVPPPQSSPPFSANRNPGTDIPDAGFDHILRILFSFRGLTKKIKKE